MLMPLKMVTLGAYRLPPIDATASPRCRLFVRLDLVGIGAMTLDGFHACQSKQKASKVFQHSPYLCSIGNIYTAVIIELAGVSQKCGHELTMRTV